MLMNELNAKDDHYAIQPIVHGYWIQARLPNLLMRLNDKFWSIILPLINGSKKTPQTCNPPNTPKKILLSNLANIGDVIISLSLAKAIKDYYPEVAIGFLAGSWCKGVLNNHPLLNYVHYYDHWYMNQYKKPLWFKIILNVRRSKQISRELSNVGYDAAIDLYHLFPNSIPLLWRADIPRRFGYISGGFGPFLTDPRSWEANDKQIAYNHLQLVRKLFPKIPQDIKLTSWIMRNEQINVTKKWGVESRKYIICHPSCSIMLRNWSTEKWIELKEELLSRKYTLVFTGLGTNEEELVSKIILNSPNCINLCGKLSWFEFVEVTANAMCTCSSDTGITHLAAAVNVPSVIMFGGISYYKNLQPLSDNVSIVYKKLPCVPCYRRFGCVDLECIRGAAVAEVLNAIEFWSLRMKTRE